MRLPKLSFSHPAFRQTLASGLLFFTISSGCVDAYRLLIPSLNTNQMYSNEDLALANWVRRHTKPSSLWLTGAYHNNWLFNLTGRKVLMGYEGWLWTHGYDYSNIRADLIRMFEGPSNKDLFRKYNVDYILIGPVEREQWGARIERFDANFKTVKKTMNYTIYSTERSPLVDLDPIIISSGTKLFANRDLSSDYYLRPGFLERVYPNQYFFGTARKKYIRSAIDFHYDSGQDRPFRSPCSIVWDGYLKIPTSGDYTFVLESDDGSWLFINEDLVVDNGGIHGLRTIKNQVTLEKGYHKVKVKYFDETGGVAFHLRWIAPEGNEELINSDFFFHDIRFEEREPKYLLSQYLH